VNQSHGRDPYFLARHCSATVRVRRQEYATAALDGSAYLLTGWVDGPMCNAQPLLLSYDLAGDRWTDHGPVSGPRHYRHLATIGRTLLVYSGGDEGGEVADLVFHPERSRPRMVRRAGLRRTTSPAVTDRTGRILRLGRRRSRPRLARNLPRVPHQLVRRRTDQGRDRPPTLFRGRRPANSTSARTLADLGDGWTRLATRGPPDRPRTRPAVTVRPRRPEIPWPGSPSQPRPPDGRPVS
jgi:hypothetical protein